MSEQWKDVSGYEGRYQVSDRGRVRGVVSGKVLKPQLQNAGYLIVHLSNGRRRDRTVGLVHRLVAGAFIGASDLHVNHKDGNKTNNLLVNLEWATRSENMAHAFAHGLASAPRHKVVGTPLGGGEPITFVSQCAVEQYFRGRNTGVVARCIAGKCGSAYGYTWSRA